MDNIQKGHQITEAFRYVQQVCDECKRIFLKIDNQMAPDWSTIYGNLITRDVSKSLQESDRWLVSSIFRVYAIGKDEPINKAVTISFWEADIDQPIITAGKITYLDVRQRNHWDLWNIWYHWEDDNGKNEYELDGQIYKFNSKECEYIKEAQVFSVPLISISDDEALIKKIINPLKAL